MTVLRAVSVTIAGVLPAFGVGALAVQVRSEFGVGPASIGLATAVLFAVSGSLARPLGGVVQRIGSRRGMALAALLSTAALTVAALAPTFPVLVAALVVGGLGNALAQPAANLSISEQIGPGRLGLAFGVKQSSIPAATMLAGLAVPGIALVFGWRWAMGAGAVLALATTGWALTARRGARPAAAGAAPEPDRGLPLRGLVLLTIGGGLGAAASTCLGVFLVDSGVDAGLEPAHAGLLYAGCSLLGLSGRIGLGWAADRSPGRSPYVLIANLLTVGALGYVLLASGGVTAFAIGAVLAYGAGWAWTGLFHYAIVRDNRIAAASATGFVQTGLSLGAASGPLAFGVLAEATSYGPAWAAAAALAVVAALTVRGGRRTVRRARGLPVASLRPRPVAAPGPRVPSHPPDTYAKESE